MIHILRRPTAALGLLALLAATPATAEVETPSPLRGELFVAGVTTVDPPPGEARDSHAYVTLTGPGAKRLYQAMKAKDEPDLCQSGRMRRRGDLACRMGRGGRDYSCSFGLDLGRGALAPGSAC